MLKKKKKMRLLNNRDQSSLKKEPIPGLEQGKYRVILEYFEVTGKVLKK